jgi:hypothetical protein
MGLRYGLVQGVSRLGMGIQACFRRPAQSIGFRDSATSIVPASNGSSIHEHEPCTRQPVPEITGSFGSEFPIGSGYWTLCAFWSRRRFCFRSWLLISVLIKLGSKGPILFYQERVGHLGQRFTCLKFRTMVTDADTSVHEGHCARLIDSDLPMVKMDSHGDSRVVPFGRQLRATGLDELPQVINVLRGDMSLVGPRPCLPANTTGTSTGRNSDTTRCPA